MTMKKVAICLLCAAAVMPRLSPAATAVTNYVKMTPLTTFTAGTNATLEAAKAYTDQHTAVGMTTNVVRNLIDSEVGGTNAVKSATATVTANAATWNTVTAKQDKIPDYTTTNAVHNIVTGYGYETATHASQTYQPKGNYLTSETDPVWSAAKSQYQKVIADYTTTNAVKSIVEDYGYATESYVDDAVETAAAAKRNLTDNTCYKTEAGGAFGQWSRDSLPEGVTWEDQPTYDAGIDLWSWAYNGGSALSDEGGENATSLTFGYGEGFTSTRTATSIAISNDTFTTYQFVTNAIATATPSVDFTTNNTVLVNTITNLAPTKARGISLTDPIRHCNWYQSVTNGVFFWAVED